MKAHHRIDNNVRLQRYYVEPLEARTLLTVLTFEPPTDDPWFGDGPEVSQSYGDHVSGELRIDGFIYGSEGGATPNVQVSYRADGGAVRRWHDGYGDLQDVVYADNDSNGILRIRLKAAKGYHVELKSLRLATSSTSMREIKAVQVLNENGDVLDSTANYNVPGTDDEVIAQHVTRKFTEVVSSELEIRIDASNLSFRGWERIGIDDITFEQVKGNRERESLRGPLYVITHGAQPDPEFPLVSDNNLPDWVVDMAKAINTRTGMKWPDLAIQRSEISYDPAQRRVRPSIVSNGDYIEGSPNFLLFNWAAVSGIPSPHVADEDEVAGMLAGLIADRLSGDEPVDIHFIGHSRGSYVNAEVIERLADLGLESKIGFLQMTTLDPQAYGSDGFLNANPGEIVDYADNYYQKVNPNIDAELSGKPIEGALNFDLTAVLGQWEGRSGVSSDHAEVHDWYHWTIDIDDEQDGSWYRDEDLLVQQLKLVAQNKKGITTLREILYGIGVDTDADGSADLQDLGRNAGFHWSRAGAFAPRQPIKTTGLDLVLVIDTTGSMGDDIARVKEEAAAIVSGFYARQPSSKVGIVAYRDQYDIYITKTILPMTADPEAAITAINSLEVDAGGDTREAVYSGLMHALNMEQGLGKWRGGTIAKRILLFGDAPPHDPETFGKKYTKQQVMARAYTVDPADIYGVVVGSDENAARAFESISNGARGATFAAATPEEVVQSLIKAIGVAGPGFGSIDQKGVLHVVGTPSNDEIRIRMLNNGQLRVRVNDVDELFDRSAVSRLRIVAQTGNDRITVQPKINARVAGNSGKDTIVGGNGEDRLEGGKGKDRLVGHRGDDVLIGGEKDDILRGNRGRDTLFGGTGDDVLEGMAGKDRLVGGKGKDAVRQGKSKAAAGGSTVGWSARSARSFGLFNDSRSLFSSRDDASFSENELTAEDLLASRFDDDDDRPNPPVVP